jgi:hypothetical protein
LEEISNSSFAAVELPAAKDTTSREKEDNRVETEEELGIFQLLDRLEEVNLYRIYRISNWRFFEKNFLKQALN